MRLPEYIEGATCYAEAGGIENQADLRLLHELQKYYQEVDKNDQKIH